MKLLFFTAISAALFGLSTFFRKLTVDKLHPFQLQIIAGSIYIALIPMWIYFAQKGGHTKFNPEGVIFGVLCIITAMSGAILFSFLLKSTNDPGALAIYIAGFEPLIALATIQIFLGGELTLQKIIGSLFTVAGITILSL